MLVIPSFISSSLAIYQYMIPCVYNADFFLKQQMGTSWFGVIARFDVQDLNLIALFAAFQPYFLG